MRKFDLYAEFSDVFGRRPYRVLALRRVHIVKAAQVHVNRPAPVDVSASIAVFSSVLLGIDRERTEYVQPDSHVPAIPPQALFR